MPIGASPLAQFGIDDPICICVYRGVRDGLCYLKVYFTHDPDGPKAVLSRATDAVTFFIQEEIVESCSAFLWV